MLEIRLLGQFEVRRAGALVAIPSRPAQSLLAYLLLNPRAAHRREKLAGLLWPEASEANARSYLRKALWQIRKSLGADRPGAEEYLAVDEISIAFDAHTDHWLDSAVLARKLSESGPLDDLMEAAAVYRGELLPGFYDEWAVLERERLRAVFDQKMNRLLDRLVAEGRWPQALEWGEHWIGLGAAPESAYRALMAAHAALGDMAKVAAVYERCLQALRDDLGVEPSEQTRALYQRLISGEELAVGLSSQPASSSDPKLTPSRVPAPPQTSNLPVPLTSFIGREREVAEVTSRLSSSRLLTLTGAGGSGKTRLAIRVATEISGAFQDGEGWVELVGLADPALVPQAVASTLGVREALNLSISETLAHRLRAKRLLLILDNCEHLIEACARLVELLLSSCPGVTVLATSRETLGIPGERVFQVPTLSMPEAGWGSLPHLLGYESVRLFVERAATIKSDFVLNKQNAAAVAQICRRLDGIPLALELAAARISVLTVEQIAARLDDRFRLLTGGSRTALPRHQTLRATLDWSYALLSEVEQTMLQRLSVFAGGWTLEAAETVCSGSGLDRSAVLDLTMQLVNKSLVLADRRADEEARYRLLETIREYARDKLAEAQGAEAMRDRHLEYFLRLAEAAEPKLFGGEQVAWFNRLESDLDNLRAATDWALKHELATAALRLVSALLWFWDQRSPLAGSETLLRVVLSPATKQRSAVRAKALNTAGYLQWERGDSAEAQRLLEEALAIGRDLGSNLNVAWSLQFLGCVATTQGNYEAAHSYFEEGLALAQKLGATDTPTIGVTLSHQGDLALFRGEYDLAHRLYEEGAARLRESGEKSFLAYPIRRLGQTALHQGDLETAAALCKQSLALNLEVGDERGIAGCLAGLAGVAMARGQAVRVAQLLGAVTAVLETIATDLLPSDRLEYDRNVTAARAQLDEAAFTAAWAEGRAMTLDEAVAYALGEGAGSPQVAGS